MNNQITSKEQESLTKKAAPSSQKTSSKGGLKTLNKKSRTLALKEAIKGKSYEEQRLMLKPENYPYHFRKIESVKGEKHLQMQEQQQPSPSINSTIIEAAGLSDITGIIAPLNNFISALLGAGISPDEITYLMRAIAPIIRNLNMSARVRIWEYLELIFSYSKSIQPILKVVNFLGGVVSVADIGFNVLGLICNISDIYKYGSLLSQQVIKTINSMRYAYDTFKIVTRRTSKTDFKYFLSDWITEDAEYICEEWNIVGGTRSSAFAALSSAVNTYIRDLRNAVSALKPFLTTASEIMLQLATIALNVTSIVSMFIAPPAGLIISAAAGAGSFVIWVITHFELHRSTIESIITIINELYIPIPFAPDISTETKFVDLFL